MLAIVMASAPIFKKGETVTIAAKAFGDAWAKGEFGAGWLTAGHLGTEAPMVARIVVLEIPSQVPG